MSICYVPSSFAKKVQDKIKIADEAKVPAFQIKIEKESWLLWPKLMKLTQK